MACDMPWIEKFAIIKPITEWEFKSSILPNLEAFKGLFQLKTAGMAFVMNHLIKTEERQLM